MTTNASSSPASGKNKRFQVLPGAILVQLIPGTVYGYSIFCPPLTLNIFPTILTEAQQITQAAAGDLEKSSVVVADDPAVKLELVAKQQGILKYAFSICILSFVIVFLLNSLYLCHSVPLTGDNPLLDT